MNKPSTLERLRRWYHADGPGPDANQPSELGLFSAAPLGALASPSWTAQDRAFEAELRRRLGGLYRGFTGQGYANRYGGGFVARPAGRTATNYVLHHTAGAASGAGAGIWSYHVGARGWDTIGYSLLVSPDGSVELLVPPSMMTYGSGATNPTSVHVSCHGNYAGAEPPFAMLGTVYQVLCALDQCYGGRPWRGHKELPGAATACPGRLLPHLQRMRGGQYGASVPPKPAYP